MRFIFSAIVAQFYLFPIVQTAYCDSLMVYINNHDSIYVKIETSPSWSEVTIPFNSDTDTVLYSITFKPFNAKDSVDSSGFNIWFMIDDLTIGNDIFFDFNADSLIGWSVYENDLSEAKILSSDYTPNPSGKSALMAFWDPNDFRHYPDVSFRFIPSDSGYPMQNSDSISVWIRSGFVEAEFRAMIPLEIGNSWVYRHSYWDEDGGSSSYYTKKSVVDTVGKPNGFTYYHFIQSYSNRSDTLDLFYRIDPNGFLLQYIFAREDTLYRDFVNTRHGSISYDGPPSNPYYSREVHDRFRILFEGDIPRFERWISYHYYNPPVADLYIDDEIAFGIGITGHGDLSLGHGVNWFSGFGIRGALINGVVYGDTSFGVVAVSTDPQVAFSLNLLQNYPNPFNPTTIISYSLPAAEKVTLIIYNLRGQEIVRLVEEFQSAGYFEYFWDAELYSSGIYFYRLQAGGLTLTKKMLLLK